MPRETRPAIKRKRYLINKPFQLRYMVQLVFLLLISFTMILSIFYVGVWGSVLEAISDEQVRRDLVAIEIQDKAEAPTYGYSAEDQVFKLFHHADALGSRQRSAVKKILRKANTRIIPAFVIFTFWVAWGSIFLTHRIVGPFYRINQDLKRVDKKDLTTRIHIRKNDEGQEVVASINRAVAGFDFFVILLKKIIRENEADLPRMKERLSEELNTYRTTSE